MTYASLLVHPLAIVTPQPVVTDPTDTDDWGQPQPMPDAVVLVNGLVQPVTATEAAASHQGGVELSTHVIFLLPRNIAAGSYIRDQPDTGRRFDITGVRSFEFGTAPHLEVDVRLIGSTEGAGVGS